ncbi:MAG: hypothetical protein IJ796_10805 [Lachnospiraceae bacterium]|nr:hypothetical protein [Lachnospiraceae bacterium]
MIIDKNLKDIKVELQDTPEGKVKEVYVYAGALYESLETEKEHKRTALVMILLGAFAAALFVLGLFFESTPAHTVYAILPYAVNFLTYVFLVRSIAMYMPQRDKNTKKQKSVGFEMFRPIGFIGALLGLISLVGAIICLIKAGNSDWRDILFLICDGLQTAIFGAYFFIGRKLVSKISEIRQENLHKTEAD